MPSVLFYFKYLDMSISNWLLLIIAIIIIEFRVFNAISVDPDQTPRSVASGLGLLCLLLPRGTWIM